jgi:hypothetical protein
VPKNARQAIAARATQKNFCLGNGIKVLMFQSPLMGAVLYRARQVAVVYRS